MLIFLHLGKYDGASLEKAVEERTRRLSIPLSQSSIKSEKEVADQEELPRELSKESMIENNGHGKSNEKHRSPERVQDSEEDMASPKKSAKSKAMIGNFHKGTNGKAQASAGRSTKKVRNLRAILGKSALKDLMAKDNTNARKGVNNQNNARLDALIKNASKIAQGRTQMIGELSTAQHDYEYDSDPELPTTSNRAVQKKVPKSRNLSDSSSSEEEQEIEGDGKTKFQKLLEITEVPVHRASLFKDDQPEISKISLLKDSFAGGNDFDYAMKMFTKKVQENPQVTRKRKRPVANAHPLAHLGGIFTINNGWDKPIPVKEPPRMVPREERTLPKINVVRNPQMEREEMHEQFANDLRYDSSSSSSSSDSDDSNELLIDNGSQEYEMFPDCDKIDLKEPLPERSLFDTDDESDKENVEVRNKSNGAKVQPVKAAVEHVEELKTPEPLPVDIISEQYDFDQFKIFDDE